MGVLLQAPPIPPVSPEFLSGWDRLGVVAVLVGVILLLGYLLLSRKIVLGSTCDLLVANERKQKERAQSEAVAAREDVLRIADDFNANLSTVVRELGKRSASAE